MRAISAADSVSPAIQRTRQLLFRPFNWGTYLKLGLVALITEGFAGNFSSANHGGSSTGSAPDFRLPFGEIPSWIPAVFMVLLAALLIGTVFYLVTRLRFSFFHCLIHNTTEIRPGWWLYRAPAIRFFWLNVGVGICFLLLVGLLAIPFIAGFVRLFHESQQGAKLDLGLLISLVLPLLPIMVLLGLAGLLADIVLRDFMLPHFALENATAGQAWSRVWARIKGDSRQFIVYAILRVVLPTVAMVAVFIVLFIPGLILAGSLAVVELGIHSLFSDATGASALVGTLLQVFFGVLGFGFLFLASICVAGPVSTGIREYALVFYGGRYQALGDILFPPSPYPQS
jgi:hypothetical protein